MSRFVVGVCLLVVVHTSSAQQADVAAKDHTVALSLVTAHCSGCHSLKLVSAQRGGPQFWLNTIRWMQNTQNLWEIPVEQEGQIVAYLSEVYAEESWGRRPNLAPPLRDAELMPLPE